ncbi:FAD-dependent oxidoreductase [Streptomyces hoynatensis]|uniref:FAD-dependent monooxygenase n=1 Tax=Streptomyces hoynatensis TaxID=1141874 RepID=A0A3A9YQI1_9ACTN|nr:NAD(P)/FAD-dependent oxidoreductase [Streptomyces hoynatensis]RKN38149.1 FAD-dependent monooxygenase [Streptomyces hoynatensis]
MRVVVVGGGVAGAASAVALRRIGAEVTVYEAYEDPAGPVGSFVSLAVNALRGLDALGCLPAVQRAGFPVERQRMWSGGGKLLGDVPRGRPEGEPLRSVTLLRADLVRVLRAEARRAGARIVTGRRLTSFTGEPTAGADLLIGADGLWSAVRRAVDPAAPEPAYAGLYGVAGVSREAPGQAPAESAFHMIFGRRGAFIHLPRPDGTVWWSAQIAAAAPPPDLAEVDAARLAALFRTEERAVEVLRAAEGKLTSTLFHVLPRLPRRYRGRMVLIGDAAHPVGAGQGAAMAIEDAVVLARQLHRTGEVAAALAAWDQEREARLGKMARAAARNREAKTAGPLASRLRNLVMPVVFPRVYPRATGWLYAHELGELPAADAEGARG